MNPPTFLASFVLTILHSVDFHFLKKCMKLTFCLVFKTFSSESLISKKQVLVSHHGDVASRKAMLILNKLFYFANSVNMVLDFLKKRKKKDETLFPNYTSITADTERHKTHNRSGWIGISDDGQRFISPLMHHMLWNNTLQGLYSYFLVTIQKEGVPLKKTYMYIDIHIGHMFSRDAFTIKLSVILIHQPKNSPVWKFATFRKRPCRVRNVNISIEMATFSDAFWECCKVFFVAPLSKCLV